MKPQKPIKGMTTDQKQKVSEGVKQFVASFPSQRVAAANLKGVSEALLVQVQKGNWDQISAAMWRSLGKQVGVGNKEEWKIVQTRDFKTLLAFVEDSKVYGNVHAIIGPAGSGKTFTAEYCTRTMPNVMHLQCAEYWNKKQFCNELLGKLGKDHSGLTTYEAMESIVATLLRLDEPVIILDEADKLNDSVLYFFITLYNKLHNSCGIIMMATDHLMKRIDRGRNANRKGYAEIYSRIARRFIGLKGPNNKEMQAICTANGIVSEWEVNSIVNESESDLRRVERGVHKSKILANSAALSDQNTNAKNIAA
jgi:DNA transposition AAA+ family ATPase